MKLPSGSGQSRPLYIYEPFSTNKVPKRMNPPFHICLLYEGEYEDPYSQFVRCFDEEVLSRFPSFYTG